MIEFQEVSLVYGDHVVLDGISFAAGFHERIAILGGSGEGKTSIIKLMLGLIRPDSGRIIIDGNEISNMPESRLRDVRMNFSIVFQEGALFDSVNVHENVAFCLREYYRLSEEEIEARIRGLLRRLNIEEAIELMPEELSGGMARRVAIARSLAGCDPKVMLYDEPTTGLHFFDIQKLLEVLNRLVEGGNSVIVIEHNLDVIKCADHIIDLGPGGGEEGGRVIVAGTPEEVILNRKSHTGRFLKRKLLLKETVS